jgi:hypothetical protein
MRFCSPGTKLIGINEFITCYIVVKRVGANCKNHDKLINYTVRVSKSDFVFFSSGRICQESRISSFFSCLWAVSRVRRELITIYLTSRIFLLYKHLQDDVSKSESAENSTKDWPAIESVLGVEIHLSNTFVIKPDEPEHFPSR